MHVISVPPPFAFFFFFLPPAEENIGMVSSRLVLHLLVFLQLPPPGEVEVGVGGTLLFSVPVNLAADIMKRYV